MPVDVTADGRHSCAGDRTWLVFRCVLFAESMLTMQASLVTTICSHGAYWKARSSSAGLLRSLLFAAVFISLSTLANGQTLNDGHRTYRLSAQESPEVATELVDVVEAFIAAGGNADPAARGKYLAPKIFYYGHVRTREQAVKEIASLFRRWPQRKYAPAESIDLFEIPKRRGVYRITAVYGYKFNNLNEHLSGKSKLTCVLEHDAQGTRIIGVDEKLMNESTQYQQN
jgi:hypothetical protein